MEDEVWSIKPFLSENYTSLRDLEARWMRKQQEEHDRLGEEGPQQQERENLKQLQPQQHSQQLFHLHSRYEEERRRRRTPYNHSNEVDSWPKAYTNISNRRDDRNAWQRSHPQVIGGMYQSYGVDRRSKLEALAYKNVAMEERKSDGSELINVEKKDYESRRERNEDEVKEPDEVVGESLPVAVSSTAMMDGAMKLRAEAGVTSNPRAESKETVGGRREENAGEMHVPVDEKKVVGEEGDEAVRNPRGKRKGKWKAKEKENVGEMHMPAEKGDAVDKEVEKNKVQVARNTRGKKKGKRKARGEESVGKKGLSTEEDAQKDNLVVRKSGSELNGRSEKEEKKENERNIVVGVAVQKKMDVSVVRNSRIERNGVKRENRGQRGESGSKLNVRSETEEKKENERNIVVGVAVQKKMDVSVVRNSRIERNGVKGENQGKRGEVMVESKEMEMKVGLSEEKGSKIRAESESMKEEVGDEKEKVRNLSMQYTNDLRGSDGMEDKRAKDNESNIRADGKSLKDKDGVVEENMRNGEKIDPCKENKNEIRAESEVWKNDEVAVEEILRNGMKIDQGKENENKIWAEIEFSKDEVGVVEEKSRHPTMPNGVGPRGSNGMKTELGKESESLKIVVKEVREKLGGHTLKQNGWKGRSGMKCSNGVHEEYRKNNRLPDGMRMERKNSGGEKVWVRKEESGDGKSGGTRTSSLD